MNDALMDVAVVGGGLVGASFVLALAQMDAEKRFSVCQLEALAAQAAASIGTTTSDERHLALNAYSWQTLQQLGVSFDATRCSAITRIHISSRGNFGRVLLDAAEEGVKEFGRLVPASHLRSCLEKALQRCTPPWLERRFGARLQALAAGAEHARLTMADGTECRARLVIGADGTESSVRALMARHSPVDDRLDYGSQALSFNVLTEYDAAGTAFERFTEHGPIALLPLPNRRMGAVWTLPEAGALAALHWSEAQFLERFQAAFGYRLGRFSDLSKRSIWPMIRLRAKPDFGLRCALIGNAAQTIHPLGAQGFNLGLRDAVALAVAMPKIAEVFDAPKDLQAALQHFSDARAADRASTLRFSDMSLVATQNNTSLARIARSMAFLGLDTAPLAKRSLTRFGLGFVR